MKLLSLADLKPKGIRYSRVHIYRLIKHGEFPRPVRLGKNRVAFVESEIEAWLNAKVAERDAATAA